MLVVVKISRCRGWCLSIYTGDSGASTGVGFKMPLLMAGCGFKLPELVPFSRYRYLCRYLSVTTGDSSVGAGAGKADSATQVQLTGTGT